MKNIKLTIQYDGTRYNGWQNQKNTANTIQTKLETVLSRMANAPIALAASGRTDAGVHASGQIANFKTNTTHTCAEVIAYANEYLPADIAVIDAEEVDERFHSRLHALGKTYVYRIWNSSVPNVFERQYLHTVTTPLNLALMRQAAALLTGTHDFQSFCATKAGKKSTVRTLSSIEIEVIGSEVRLTFTGDGFLYHMVRILVGTLIEIGLGKRQASELPNILVAKERSKAGHLAPAQGLCLTQVFYPA
ncbi:MAG: tRNA pseudouridine(38-40) synthase TruA [Faecalibacterium sp.]